MLTRPEISDNAIIAGLRDSFGLPVAQATFLPIGADVNSFSFRVTAVDGTRYFLKLRRGHFDEIAVLVPAFLHTRGIRRVMAPIATVTGQLSVSVAGFHWMLYPYFEGTNGFETALSKAQWIALGETMRAVHTTVLPADLAGRVPREDFGPRCRSIVRAFHEQVRRCAYADLIAARFAAFWMSKRHEIESIVERAKGLAQALQNRAADLVICHSDLHAGNVLVGANDELAIVDWDEPILALKERDLMFVGGGVGGIWNQDREAAWFYEGYGHVEVEPIALAYYRYERIVADFAAYGEQILGGQGSAEDREKGLRQVANQFLPGNVIEMAHRSCPYPG